MAVKSNSTIIRAMLELVAFPLTYLFYTWIFLDFIDGVRIWCEKIISTIKTIWFILIADSIIQVFLFSKVLMFKLTSKIISICFHSFLKKWLIWYSTIYVINHLLNLVWFLSIITQIVAVHETILMWIWEIVFQSVISNEWKYYFEF